MQTINGRTLEATLAADRLLSARASESFATFYRYVFRYDTPAHIRILIECLQALEDDHFDRLLVVEPPGHAKSTVVSLAFPAWYVGRHPDRSVIGATTTGTLAELYVDSIAELIENDDRYQATFPTVRPDKKRGWSKKGLFVQRPFRPGQKDASIALVGAGGPIIGRRADLMLLDDTVDEPVARSDVRMLARRQWAQQSVRSRLKPGGKIVVAGTVWAEDDVIGLMREFGTYVELRMHALSGSKKVFAEVHVPDGIAWRPRGGIEYDPIDESYMLAAGQALTAVG